MGLSGLWKGDFQLLGFHSFSPNLHPEPQQTPFLLLFQNFLTIANFVRYCVAAWKKLINNIGGQTKHDFEKRNLTINLGKDC